MKSSYVKASLGAGVATIAAVLYFKFGGNAKLEESGNSEQAEEQAKKDTKIQSVSPVKSSAAKTSLSAGDIAQTNEDGEADLQALKDLLNDPEHPLSEKEMALAIELQEMIDDLTNFLDGDTPDAKAKLENTWKILSKAAKSTNPALRKTAIETYAWLGSSSSSSGTTALIETTALIADVDEEVAEMAIDTVEQLLMEEENASLRFKAATTYMSTFSANEDALTMLSGISSAAAMDLVDPVDDTPQANAEAAANRQSIVDTIANLIEASSDLCAEQAKELYSDITSEDWIDRNEAGRWAQDPENYEAPDIGNAVE